MDSKSITKISVLMAVRNGEKYLQQAIDSILAQTFMDFEFIIIDDDSSDHSIDIVQGYRDRRIRHMQNHKHLGLTLSLNLGLEAAQGEYIARMDADDISLPGRFEEQIRFLDCHPEVTVLGTGIRLIDVEGNPIRDVHFPSDSDLIKWGLCFYNPIAHPSVMMRKQAIQRLGGYDPAYKRSQDYDLWWRIGFISELANLDEIYILLRQHPSQVMNIDRSGQFHAGIDINQKHLSTLLGKQVSKELIQKLWNRDFLSLDDALSTSQLIFEIFQKVNPTVHSKSLKKILANDALSMILPILISHLAEYRGWRQIWKSVSLSPFGFMRIFGELAPRYLLKTLKSRII